MDRGSKFGRGVSTPQFIVEHGAELEGWNRFIRRFEIAVIGAGLKNSNDYEAGGATTRGKGKEEAQKRFEVEQRKAALLLDSMGEIGMDIFDTWNMDVSRMQYDELKYEFSAHFQEKENIVATRHRYLAIEQRSEERVDKFIERVDRAARTCRWGDLVDDLIVQVVIKGLNNDKLRAELLGKKKLDADKVKAVCLRFESAKTAANIITKDSDNSRTMKPEVDRVEDRVESDQNKQLGEEEQPSIDRVGYYRGGYSRGNNSYRGRGGFRGRGGPSRGIGRGRGCFICNSQSHLMRECPSANKEKKGPRFGKCYVCGGPHFARECPKSKDGGSGQPQNSKGQVNAISGYSSDSEESL